MTKRLNLLTIALILIAASIVMGQTGTNAALKNPASLKEMAPATYKVDFDTSVGAFVVEVHRDWAPNGADRFYNLVKSGFFSDVRFFRVIPGFMVQFGIHGDPSIASAWQAARIPDDKVKASNRRGYVTFATAGPNTRTTQLFINFGNNSGLDHQSFTPFGLVTDGMDTVDKLYASYGEGAPEGHGPNQALIGSRGRAYLEKYFPKLDTISSASIVPAAPAAAPAK